MTAAPHSEHASEASDKIRERIDELYPGRLALLLISLCSPKPHQHRDREGVLHDCEDPGKRPIETAWNAAAVARLEHSECRDAHVDAIVRHAASGGNIGWTAPPGVVVLDADAPAAVAWLGLALTDAPMQTTLHGTHFVVRVPPDLAINATVKRELEPGIHVDVRSGSRAQIVVEPSRHAAGFDYSWRWPLPADLADLPECPPRILERLVEPMPKAGNGSANGGKVHKGERNHYLFRIGSGMRGRGLVESEIREELHRENTRRCDPLLAEHEVETIVGSVMRYPAGAAEPSEPTGSDRQTILVGEFLTDRGNARRLAALHGSSLAWVPEWRSWAHFDAGRWRWPADEKALELAQSVSDAMLDLRGAIPDEAVRAKFIREAAKLQQVRTAQAALEAAKPDLLAHATDFDARPDLLNCPNGVLDLTTLSLRPHDPADRLTLMTAADFRPDATFDLWNKTLEAALPAAEPRDFLQVLAGVTLAGDLHLDLVLLLYGITRTMKGTVQGGIHSALGDYAYTTGLDDLAERERARPGGARPELVKLQGRRMVSIYETSRSLKLDAALLKSIAGSDPITARDVYARPITFLPQFTLWIASNYRPGLPADDGAVWERIREVPFECQIAEADRKPEVRAILADPAQAGPAVLAWCVEGLRRYREKGITVPDAVRNATRAYRDEMDVLAEFGDERLVFGDGMQATPAAIRGAYDAWIRGSSGDRVTAGELGAWLRSRGCIYKQEPGSRRRLWYGVGVVHEESRS